ncbi:hypothetical protein QAD02_020708 [Eretmocerus hayati]|uniref:Uncharacterized protein n=1 Tax=Eretmocerus hayati TaxID=131215 RepID=A0ACC2PSX8_9HYME|nr:hypothetical protein QAD02_020708 [Eretmocerus hayati]
MTGRNVARRGRPLMRRAGEDPANIEQQVARLDHLRAIPNPPRQQDGERGGIIQAALEHQCESNTSDSDDSRSESGYSSTTSNEVPPVPHEVPPVPHEVPPVQHEVPMNGLFENNQEEAPGIQIQQQDNQIEPPEAAEAEQGRLVELPQQVNDEIHERIPEQQVDPGQEQMNQGPIEQLQEMVDRHFDGNRQPMNQAQQVEQQEMPRPPLEQLQPAGQQENEPINQNRNQENFDERMEAIRERAWRGAVEVAFGGDAPHIVVQRQLEEEARRLEAGRLRMEEERRQRDERRRENMQDERMRRYRQLIQERRMRDGPRLQNHHNRVIRLELRNRPVILNPPAPGLLAGVVPFANLGAPQNDMELAFFEAIDGDQFLAINGEQPGGAPVVLHVSGICAIAPDNSTWRCLRCVRTGSRNGFNGRSRWWMHHLHLTGLRSRIRLMFCPGCNNIAFEYFSRHSCQSCLEVYHAHRREILIGVIFESMIARVVNEPSR